MPNRYSNTGPFLNRICLRCGSKFHAKLSRIKIGKGKYCSKHCYDKSLIMDINQTFWIRVQKTSSCWIWTGVKDIDGYGLAKFYFSREKRAHRLSYEIHFGTIPRGMHVLHKCDNPSCVSPEHIFLGTNIDNIRDMVKKGRNAKGFTNGRGMAKLTNEDIISIRDLLKEKTQKEVAAIFGMSYSCINGIKTGRSWRHLLGHSIGKEESLICPTKERSIT